MSSKMKKQWWILPPVAAGIVVVLLFYVLRSPPERSTSGERAVSVRTMVLTEMEVVPRALGYGTASAGNVWEAISEVGGRVVAVHPDYEAGSLLRAGAVLMRIDPADYHLAVSQRRASLESAEAQLAQLEVEELNLEANLEIERRALTLSENDLKRNIELVEQSSISESMMEQIERDLLRQRNQVQNLENSVSLIPTRRSNLEAQRDLAAAQLEDAELDLERTEIRVPFACRVAEKRIEKQEYARPGDIVAVAHGVDRAEVVAQVVLDRLRHVVPASAEPDPEEFAGLSSEQIFERFGLEAVVRLQAGESAIEWPARFERFGASLDPTTRTISVTVSVDEPYRNVVPGVRPALVHGMYCEVELKGMPRKALPVPRSAVHGDLLYVVDGDGRLELRPVEVAWVQGNLAILEAGAEPGEKIVLSDVVPAIAGTQLLPQDDEQAVRRLELEALGKAKAR